MDSDDLDLRPRVFLIETAELSGYLHDHPDIDIWDNSCPDERVQHAREHVVKVAVSAVGDVEYRADNERPPLERAPLSRYLHRQLSGGWRAPREVAFIVDEDGSPVSQPRDLLAVFMAWGLPMDHEVHS